MHTCRVLIVDDQRDIRRVLRTALETLNQQIQVTDVPSGEEAILVISRQPVDVLVSDVRLPGISGLELIERARVRNPHLRLVLITGMTDDKVRRQVEAANADAFFYKPLSIDQFLTAMQELLDLSSDGSSPPASTETQPAVILPPRQPHDTRPVPRPRPAEPPPAVFAPKSPHQLVQERTATLRRYLDASLVAVVTPAGERIAVDGPSPDGIKDWPAVMETVTTFAVSPAARLRSLAFVPGAAHDFLLVSVTEQVVLLAGGVHPAWQDTAFGRLADALWGAAGDLRAAGVSSLIAPAAEDLATDLIEALEEEQALPDLSALFEQANNPALSHTDVDAFWDMAAKDHSTRGGRTGGISFEQARQLGLAPDED